MSPQTPQAGTPEYQALLLETGRSDLDGFNYTAHLEATQESGSATAQPALKPEQPSEPVVNPAKLSPVPLPSVGSPEYQALLLETGRSDLVGFNYAAHLAVKVGVRNDNFDNYLGAQSLSELQRLLGSEGSNQFFAQSSGEQIQLLVSKFGSDPEFAAFLKNQTNPSSNTNTTGTLNSQVLPAVMAGVVINAYQAPTTLRSTDTVPLPAFGSVAYKALLLETGRENLIGFNYSAHLAVKAETSLDDFDSYMNASSGEALLAMLGKVNVNELMAKASPEQVQQLIGRFASDTAFGAYLDATTTPDLPTEGSAAHDALLASTGLKDLAGFDYQGHLRMLTEAQQAITTANVKVAAMTTSAQLVGSASNDKLVYVGTSFVMLAGGDGDDELVAGDNGSLLLPGSGNNKVVGGAKLDMVVLANNLSEVSIGKTPDGDWVVHNTITNDTNELSHVERLVFDDFSLALDVTPEHAAGKTAMILGAVFGKEAVGKLDYFGAGLDLFDQGGSFLDISTLAMSVVNKTAPEDVVDLLWTNVVGSAPTPEQARPYIDMLNAGMTPGELAELAAKTDVNLTGINLVSLAETGILYV
jgi:hypothetical protein